MSIVMTGTIVALTMANTHAIVGSHAGPVIWQGIMLILFLPFMLLFYWAWNKVPLTEWNRETRFLARKWRRVMWMVGLSYLGIGAVLVWLIVNFGI